MSGASLPYHLRPHKAVDRRIFIDLLGRLERWRPMTDYVYVSMGAYPLEDHKLIHRALGITRLVTFDKEESVAARQSFNRPIAGCHCLVKTSGEVIAQFNRVLGECGFEDPAGVVVWLDYTDPKLLGEQIREFESLLGHLSQGDVVRVTVNAHPHELIPQQTEKPIPAEARRERQFAALAKRIKDYLPSSAKADDMTAQALPSVISESFAKAALNAFPVNGTLTFRPLSIVRYADGSQMLSMTGIVVERSKEDEMLSRLKLDSWPFASENWTTIHRLVVPDLTVRERLFLEREVTAKSTTEIVAALGFDSASGVPISDFIDTYKNYYRFYPTLLAAEL